jgi:hypothetical protein
MENPFVERKKLIYERIAEAATTGNVRVIYTEVNAYDEEYTQMVTYHDGTSDIEDEDYDGDVGCIMHEDDPRAGYVAKNCDGDTTGYMKREELLQFLQDLEMDHYSIVQVDYDKEFMDWDDHEAMAEIDVKMMKSYSIPFEVFKENGSERMLETIKSRRNIPFEVFTGNESECMLETVEHRRSITLREYEESGEIKLYPTELIRMYI